MQPRLLYLPLLLLTVPAFAEVTTVLSYRMGEDDPAPATTQPVRSTMDTAHSRPLLRTEHGAPPAFVPVANSPTTQSTLAIRFDSKGFLRRTGVSIPGNDNFGIEALVKADRSDALQFIVCLGDATRGYALVRNKNTYQAYMGGLTCIGAGGEIPPGQWVRLALVRTDGKTYLYIDGKPAGEMFIRPLASSIPATLGIGGSGDGREGAFQGVIDEVRLFTFQQGKFSPADLARP